MPPKIATGTSDGALVEAIVSAVDVSLRESGSAILRDDMAREQLHAQIRGVIQTTLNRLEHPFSSPRQAARRYAQLDVGTARATQQIHPSESLLAAEALFDAALDLIVTAGHDKQPPWDPSNVARVLNSEISRVIARSSVSYVDVLLTRLAAVQREERAAIARELHDRIAHDLAAARLRLELRSATVEPEKAIRMQVEADDLLLRAQSDVQALAMQLREVVGDHTVAWAIEEFLGHADLDHRVTLTSTGDVPVLTMHAREEVFLIAREALRNALTHAAPARVFVSLSWDAGTLSLTVRDEGRGFSIADSRPSAMGLVGMRERAELIGATLEIQSAPAAGTTITLKVPFDEPS